MLVLGGTLEISENYGFRERVSQTKLITPDPEPLPSLPFSRDPLRLHVGPLETWYGSGEFDFTLWTPVTVARLRLRCTDPPRILRRKGGSSRFLV